jgi:hypothetical protein
MRVIDGGDCAAALANVTLAAGKIRTVVTLLRELV